MTNLKELEAAIAKENDRIAKITTKKEQVSTELSSVTSDYEAAKLIQEKNQAKVDNVADVLSCLQSDRITDLADSVANLKKEVPDMLIQTEKTLATVNEAANASLALEGNIKKTTSEGGFLSPDLAVDSTAANASINQALHDALKAYKSTLIAEQTISSLEQILNTISLALSRASDSDNVDPIQTTFEKILSVANKEVGSLKRSKTDKEQKLAQFEKDFNRITDSLNVLNQKKAVLESIN